MSNSYVITSGGYGNYSGMVDDFHIPKGDTCYRTGSCELDTPTNVIPKQKHFSSTNSDDLEDQIAYWTDQNREIQFVDMEYDVTESKNEYGTLVETHSAILKYTKL